MFVYGPFIDINEATLEGYAYFLCPYKLYLFVQTHKFVVMLEP